MAKDDKKDKRKEMKVVKEIKSKMKVVGERDESELERDIEVKKGKVWQKTNNGEGTNEMAGVEEFKAPSIILEASAAEEPRAEIKQATKERQEFEKEEAVRERLYGNGRGGQGSRGQRTGRDSYESAYYAAGGGTTSMTNAPAQDVFRERQPIQERQSVKRGRAVEREGVMQAVEREDRYQTQQGQQGQQRRRRYPWEA